MKIRDLYFFFFLVLLTGFVYPLFVTGVGMVFFPAKRLGALHAGVSDLVFQPYAGDAYFQGRPSASEYSTVPSGASNLSPGSPKLLEEVEKRKKYWEAKVPGVKVPSELLFTSGSGIDPHLSLEAVEYQVPVVVAARGGGVELEKAVRKIIQECSHETILTDRKIVSVNALNRKLDFLRTR